MKIVCKCGSDKLGCVSTLTLDDFISVRYFCYECEGTLNVDYKVSSISYFTKDLDLIEVQFLNKE